MDGGNDGERRRNDRNSGKHNSRRRAQTRRAIHSPPDQFIVYLAGAATVTPRRRTTDQKITGHKTESVYRRHAIVSDSDLREAALKLATASDVLRRHKSRAQRAVA